MDTPRSIAPRESTMDIRMIRKANVQIMDAAASIIC